MSYRDEDGIALICIRIEFGVSQTIYIHNGKPFKMINVCDVILLKAFDNSMISIRGVNVKDAMKEMFEDLDLVITCDGHDEVG